ncbi:MAG: YeeE/YedE thiosulfate transporter family protein [Bacteroidota bacterium]
MDHIRNFLVEPWPWYLCGALIGLTVPLLFVVGNKPLGVSSSLRDICSACLPHKLNPFREGEKRDFSNILFVAGILAGALFAASVLSDNKPVTISPNTRTDLVGLGISSFDGLLPSDMFSSEHILTVRGFLLFVVGGFLVGFGTRCAGGCTSGHTITGLSTLQWPSLVATLCFMAGGLFATHYLLPIIFNFH